MLIADDFLLPLEGYWRHLQRWRLEGGTHKGKAPSLRWGHQLSSTKEMGHGEDWMRGTIGLGMRRGTPWFCSLAQSKAKEERDTFPFYMA